MSALAKNQFSDESQQDVDVAPYELNAQFTAKVSLAQQQNEIPLLQALSFTNNTDQPLRDVRIVIKGDPNFMQETQWRMDSLAAGATFSPTKKDVVLLRSFLADCAEAVRGTLRVSVTAEEKSLLESEHAILVLPPDMWGGMGHLPELTAAYCRPNDPAVEKVLKKASQLLREAGKDVVLDGYQKKDKRRVYTQLSAIYSAMAALKLDYTNPPASFENEGQRVRLPGRIEESGLATCFDLTLFMAACFEQAGLNPLILFTQGHSFVGCWLVEDDFSHTVISDPQAIRKQQQAPQKLVLIETTLITNHSIPSFKAATEAGLKHLHEEDSFECAIDIKRARMSHIRPLQDQAEVISISRGPENIDGSAQHAIHRRWLSDMERRCKVGEELESPAITASCIIRAQKCSVRLPLESA